MSEKKFVLASNNMKKLAELSDIMRQMGFVIVSQSEAGFFKIVDETGDTFEENALLKARAAAAATGMAAVADDSGLCVDALGGAPGVYSARYGGEGRTDEERCEFLLTNMAGEKQRAAKFVSVIACVFPDGTELLSRGECAGEILYKPRGENGFGYDPLFEADGAGKSMAEMCPMEKNAVSHRGRALAKFADELRKYYADK